MVRSGSAAGTGRWPAVRAMRVAAPDVAEAVRRPRGPAGDAVPATAVVRRPPSPRDRRSPRTRARRSGRRQIDRQRGATLAARGIVLDPAHRVALVPGDVRKQLEHAVAPLQPHGARLEQRPGQRPEQALGLLPVGWRRGPARAAPPKGPCSRSTRPGAARLRGRAPDPPAGARRAVRRTPAPRSGRAGRRSPGHAGRRSRPERRARCACAHPWRAAR